MMDLMTGITAINGGLQIAKSLQQIDKGLNEAEYKMKIAELFSALADAKMSLVDAQDQIRQSSDEIARLLTFDIDIEELQLRNGFYFEADDNIHTRPYCPNCIDTKRGKFRLNRIPGQPRGHCFCGQCQNKHSI